MKSNLVRFPTELARGSTAPLGELPAEILILPVVRVEIGMDEELARDSMARPRAGKNRKRRDAGKKREARA